MDLHSTKRSLLFAVVIGCGFFWWVNMGSPIDESESKTEEVVTKEELSISASADESSPHPQASSLPSSALPSAQPKAPSIPSQEPVKYTAPGAKERGSFQSRQYRRPTVQSFSDAAREQPPIRWGTNPIDGRSDVLPEELTDEHTLDAKRVAWSVDSFQPLLEGRVAKMLAPRVNEPPLEVTFSQTNVRSDFTFTLMGKIDGEEMSDVLVVVHDGVVFGSMVNYKENRHWEYNTIDGNHMVVRELQPESYTAPCGAHDHEDLTEPQPQGVEEMLEELDLDGNTISSSENDPGIDGEPTNGYITIDMAVGYGREARIAEGGVAKMEAKILLAVDRMNLAFTNSDIADTEVMLLGTIEDPDYEFPGRISGSMSTSDELGDLNSRTDGDLDAVSDFADALGADMKSFIVKQADGSAGIAYRPGTSQITARDYMSSTRLTWAHENGHNIGCRHAWGDTDGGSSGHNYGWRYRNGNSRYRTVMAYDWGWTRTPYFSNPNVTRFSGNIRTGAVDGYDATGDETTDPRFVSGGEDGGYGSGFDGTNSALGARNANYIENWAFSRANQRTRTSLGFLTPAGSEQFTPGQVLNIVTTGLDHTDQVSLSLYLGGTWIEDIQINAAHLSGQTDWTIPTDLPAGSTYTLQLTRNNTLTVESNSFTIQQNTAPTALNLDSASIEENLSVGSIVGTFTTEDTEGGPFAYTLVSGTGDDDNSSFQIVNDRLETATIFDAESTDTTTIRVRSTDPAGSFIEETFTVTVINVDEPPLLTSLHPATTSLAIPSGVGLILEVQLDDDEFEGAVPTLTWRKASGTGTLTWDQTDTARTGVQFSEDGIYELEISADDGTNSSTLSYTVEVGATTGASATFTSEDVGNVQAAGSAQLENGIWTITGSGSDIWSQADEFHFSHIPLSGDGSITAQVAITNNPGGNSWAKAGIMMRETTSSSSRNVMLHRSANNGNRFQVRNTTGGTTSSSGSGDLGWLRLERSGNTFTGYVSSDGDQWSVLSSQTLELDENLIVGLGVTSHNDGTLTTATFSNVTLTGVQTNVGPFVDAGSPGTGFVDQPFTLNAEVTDDGLPNGNLITEWKQLSGSGTLNVGSPESLDTTGSASTADTYQIRLEANDSMITTFDDVLWIIEDLSPPTPPTELSARADSPSSIALEWTDTSSNEEGFLLQRSTQLEGPWEEVTTLPTDSISYRDTTLHPAIYFYQIIATSSTEGNSDPTPAVSASILDTDSDGIIDEFEVAAGTDPNDADSQFGLTPVASPSATASFELQTITGKYYRVCYRDSLTEGDWQCLPGYETIIGNDQPVSVQDNPETNRFYRVEVQSEPW